MPIRKKGNVEIQASANGTKVRQTGYTFYSYDKNSAALYFQFREQDGQPTDLAKATVRLVMILDDDGGKKFIPGDDEIEVISAIRGTAKYVLPDNLLGYEGKVTSYVYLDFSDGSHTDEGHFAFEIKRSLITDVIPEAGDKYVRDFEDVKEQVEQAADGAKETISKKVTEVSDTSDSAISKANQAAKTANQAKGDIQTSVSDVQSRQAGAEKDIGGLVESTESARDEAVKTMNELDYSDRNLLTGTSSEWKEYSFSNWTTGYFTYTPEQLGLSTGDTLTYSVKYDNTKDTNNDAYVNAFVNFYSNDNKMVGRIRGNHILSGEVGLSYGTKNVPEGTVKIQAYGAGKSESGNKKLVSAKEHKLQLGTRATPWTPAPEDIVLKSEIEQIKQAIIALGGEI